MNKQKREKKIINWEMVLYGGLWLILSHFIGVEKTIMGLLIIIAYHVEN